MPQFNLSQLRLQNFRAFTELTKINFGSRITLIFGKGSVGKSTIIDAINLLSSSYKNKTNLLDNTNRFHLSKKTKLKEILLGFTVGEGFKLKHRGEDKRGVDQFFIQNNEGEFYPSKIDLYSELDDAENNKFVSLQNTFYRKETLKENKFLEGFVHSKVSFIENENSWKELFEYTYKHVDKLIKNLNECRKFNIKRAAIRSKINKIQLKNNKIPKKPSEFTEKDKYNIDKLRAEERNIFDESYEARGFNPAMFPFLNLRVKKTLKKNKKDLIDIHIDFLRQKPNYKKFVKYITDDIKSQKSYLYKNYKVYKARDLFTELRGEDISFYQNSSTRFQDTMSNIDGARNTLSEFLCTSLTTICTKDFEFIDKEVFKWNDKTSGKILSADGMFSACNKMFWPVLNQIKVVRHQENFNNIARTLSQFGSSSTLSSNFHKNIEANVKAINRWYSEFGYDFNISVDKVGPRGETEIMYKKDKFKIPSDLGGSGAQHLLTFITEIVSSEDNTILLEEPEKALHASMQIKLAKLFSETSKDNQLIIETHSENLLYGLLKEIRDKKINKDEIKVIYVYMENGESKIDELELNDKGGFKSKWRDGFFTEKLDLL